MKISIPQPCHENWNEMTPQQQGAFCKVCSKVVVDFSAMSDSEVLGYFEKKKEEKTCGRFRASQLSPYEMKINLRDLGSQKNFRKIFAASLFIFFSSLFVCKSDTGQPLLLKAIVSDTTDTSAVTLRVDTAAVSANTERTTGEANIDLLPFNDPTIPEDTSTVDTTAVFMGDTAVIIPEPIITMGLTFVEPIVKGKTLCIVDGGKPKKIHGNRKNRRK